MRHYSRSVQDYFRTIVDTVRSFFHHPHTSFLRGMGILALIVIPTGLVSWGYYTFAMPSNKSTEQQTHNDALSTSTSTAQTQSQAQDDPLLSSMSNSGKATTNNNTQVSVNGQDVPVPRNGVVHKEILTNNGTTTVDISSDSSTTGSSQSTVNMQLDVHSHTDSRSGP